MDFSMKSSGQWFPMRSFSADAASSETAESWEPKVEGFSKVILGGWSWAQVTLFSIFLFFCSWKEKYYLFKCTCVLAHTCVHTHTYPFFGLYKEWKYCPKCPPKVQKTPPFDRSSAERVREAFPRTHFFKSCVSCLFISILFWKKIILSQWGEKCPGIKLSKQNSSLLQVLGFNMWTSLSRHKKRARGWWISQSHFTREPSPEASLWDSGLQTILLDRLTSGTLSHFSRVRLFVIPWTAACQAPLSMGFSRQKILEWLP